MLKAAPPISSLPTPRDIAAQIDAKKGLGQHFLLDLNLTRKIVALAGDLTGKTVYEIGPGPGGLTRALLESPAKRIVAIEKDSRCITALQPLVEAGKGRLELLEADALTVDLKSLGEAPRVIIANLPYNVGTQLLVNWLHEAQAFESMTLMFQEEVADRIQAAPHTKAYGRLSVLAQSLCRVKKVLRLPPQAFTPPPKIASAVVNLIPRVRKDLSLAGLEKITAAAFGQRRKMLRSSLKALGGETLLEKADLAPTLRAEALTIEDFERLASLYASNNQTKGL